MTSLHLATPAVSEDEFAISLSETTRWLPGRDGPHRLQTIVVRRDQQLYEYVQDLGPASQYLGEDFLMPGLGIERVGTLLDLAQKERQKRPLAVTAGFERPNVTEQYKRQAEEWWKQAQRQSTFGPAFTRQRNG